jgi:hypothetical protein
MIIRGGNEYDRVTKLGIKNEGHCLGIIHVGISNRKEHLKMDTRRKR